MNFQLIYTSEATDITWPWPEARNETLENILEKSRAKNPINGITGALVYVEGTFLQILEGNKSIVGLMIESHLKFGRQDIPADLSQLEYGKSVTDGCISWDTTEEAILKMHDKLKEVLPKRRA